MQNRGDGLINTMGRKEIKQTSMRKIIAARTTQAVQEVPHFYLSMNIEMDRLLAHRNRINGAGASHRLSVNDYFIKALSLSILSTPNSNIVFDQGSLYQYESIDISLAVAVPGGVITPIIRNTQELGIKQISEATRLLIDKARAGKLVPEDYTGGVFMISNLGMYAVSEFTAIINMPQSGALAIGACEKRVVVRNDEPTIVNSVKVTMSADHRVLDGKTGAELLTNLKNSIESDDPVLYRE